MTKEKIKGALKHRNRHRSHVVGETLHYHCNHTNDIRYGTVLHVMVHCGISHYVLEVETGPPINESFLILLSEFQIKDKLNGDWNDKR